MKCKVNLHSIVSAQVGEPALPTAISIKETVEHKWVQHGEGFAPKAFAQSRHPIPHELIFEQGEVIGGIKCHHGNARCHRLNEMRGHLVGHIGSRATMRLRKRRGDPMNASGDFRDFDARVGEPIQLLRL